MSSKPFDLSAKAIVRNAKQECLIIRRSAQSKNNAGLWDLPGGKADAGRTIDQELAREVREETGLDVRVNRVLGSMQSEMDDRIVAHLIFEADVERGNVRLSEEHDAFEWVQPSELTERQLPPQFGDFMRDYAASSEHRPKVSRDNDWYRNQLGTFKAALPDYEQLAAALESVLKEAAHRSGFHAIVQARAKTLESFAEKIVRPGKNYADPVHELTDLCGARVITHTLDQIETFCKFVEKHFQIFWEDSGDKSQALGDTEFGYLSRHYIVSFKPDVFPTQQVPAALVGKRLKAEIQVRTILQHAWADIAHELSYKNRFKLPRKWQRQFARLAAVLEEADRAFDDIRSGLNEYASNYGGYYDQKQLNEQMQRIEILLEADPENEGVAHRLAKMAMSLEEWARAASAIEPFVEKEDVSPGVLRDFGVCLCKLHRTDVHSQEFQRGQACLTKATERAPQDVDAWASLGGTYRACQKASVESNDARTYRERAKDCYRRAFEVDPSDPYPLGNYIEYEVADNPKLDISSFFRPALTAATNRCRSQIEVGINMPWAYFDLGKFELMLKHPEEAVSWYAKGIDASPAPFFLDSALGSFRTLEPARESLPGFEWCRTLLNVAKAIRFHQTVGELSSSDAPSLEPPVVIVAGYCDRNAAETHRKLLKEALAGFTGTVIGGGTTAGISGLVGDLQAENGDLRTVGYLPRSLPEDVTFDDRYKEHRRTSGDHFSLNEPMQYWADLVISGLPRERVAMIVIGGGQLASLECQIALSLGIRTAVVDIDASQVEKDLRRLGWINHTRLSTLRTPQQAGRFVQSLSPQPEG